MRLASLPNGRAGVGHGLSDAHTPAAQTRASANKNQLSFSKFKNFSPGQNLVPVYCQVIKQRVRIQMNRLPTFCWGVGGFLHTASPPLLTPEADQGAGGSSEWRRLLRVGGSTKLLGERPASDDFRLDNLTLVVMQTQPQKTHEQMGVAMFQ